MFKARLADSTDGIDLRKVLLRDVPSKIGDVMPAAHRWNAGRDGGSASAGGALISALGIERDGFRGNWLAVNVSMLVPASAAAAGGEESEEDTGWAGIYVARFLDDELD